MITPSGIVLPGKEPVALKQVIDGLYVAVNSYVEDSGFFCQSPLYESEQGVTPHEQPEARHDEPRRMPDAASLPAFSAQRQ